MSQNGKGDRPRNCFSKEFKENYDQIHWKGPSRAAQETKEKQKNGAQAAAASDR